MSFDSDNESRNKVLICGAGAAGVEAALDLADSGFKVYLADSSVAIGGKSATSGGSGDSARAALMPKLEECANHKNIEILTFTEVADISGHTGDFKVRLQRNPRYVDGAKCTACGDCSEVCPVSIATARVCDGNGVEVGTSRKAIALTHPGAIPNVFNIVKFPGSTACANDCPAGVNVQGFISLLRAGKTAQAYALLRQRCPLPASSGRVCRHRCEDKCRRIDIDEEAVAIRNLERFIADSVMTDSATLPAMKIPTGEPKGRVAIIGSGPAGLTAANDLSLKGFRVTLFEAQEKLGGMLRYGIPAWRLPKNVLDREIQSILDLGVEVHTSTRILKPKELLGTGYELAGAEREPFDAVFLATGAWGPKKLDVLGENARGVWQAFNFLYVVNAGGTPRLGKNVVVLGGNDLALDAARAALRLPGVQTVHLACLESWAEMPADPEQIETAFQEGIVIHNGLGPTGFEKANGQVVAVRFRPCTSVYDEHRSFDPIYDDSIVSTLAADTIIVAAGRGADAGVFDLETRPGGRVFIYPEMQMTSEKGVFAGGDAVRGPASMAEAIADGHRAAEAIYRYVCGDAAATVTGTAFASSVNIAPNPDPDAEPRERAEMSSVSRAGRLKPDMSEINLGYDMSQALYEADRCLECGRCSNCMECAKACPTGAVCHDEQPEEVTLAVGGVIVADRSADGLAGATPLHAPRWSSTAGLVYTGSSEELPDEVEDLSGAIVRGGAAAAEILRQLASVERPVASKTGAAALILGGGAAGMTAAQYLADQGFQIHLVEKTDRLGGLVRGRHATLDIENVSEYMQTLEKTVRSHPNIELYLNAKLQQVSGQVGDFSSRINIDGKEVSIHHAVTIVATGGQERPTEQYLLGKNQNVVTQRYLGDLLADGRLTTALREKTKPTIVMMQCVESLTSRYPYCSRVCCAQALGNALEIKSLLPYSEIVVLGGEMLAHGAEETSYQKALEKRIRFIRYSGTDRPEVGEEGRKLQVRVHDADIGRGLVIYPDMLVLSTGIAPAVDNPELARILDDRLCVDGFFMEAHPSLRPIDSRNEGEFLCGCAHRPQFLRETIADARAVAARASGLLRRASILSKR